MGCGSSTAARHETVSRRNRKYGDQQATDSDNSATNDGGDNRSKRKSKSKSRGGGHAGARRSKTYVDSEDDVHSRSEGIFTPRSGAGQSETPSTSEGDRTPSSYNSSTASSDEEEQRHHRGHHNHRDAQYNQNYRNSRTYGSAAGPMFMTRSNSSATSHRSTTSERKSVSSVAHVDNISLTNGSFMSNYGASFMQHTGSNQAVIDPHTGEQVFTPSPAFAPLPKVVVDAKQRHIICPECGALVCPLDEKTIASMLSSKQQLEAQGAVFTDPTAPTSVTPTTANTAGMTTAGDVASTCTSQSQSDQHGRNYSLSSSTPQQMSPNGSEAPQSLMHRANSTSMASTASSALANTTNGGGFGAQHNNSHSNSNSIVGVSSGLSPAAPAGVKSFYAGHCTPDFLQSIEEFWYLNECHDCGYQNLGHSKWILASAMMLQSEVDTSAMQQIAQHKQHQQAMLSMGNMFRRGSQLDTEGNPMMPTGGAGGNNVNPALMKTGSGGDASITGGVAGGADSSAFGSMLESIVRSPRAAAATLRRRSLANQTSTSSDQQSGKVAATNADSNVVSFTDGNVSSTGGNPAIDAGDASWGAQVPLASIPLGNASLQDTNQALGPQTVPVTHPAVPPVYGDLSSSLANSMEAKRPPPIQVKCDSLLPELTNAPPPPPPPPQPTEEQQLQLQLPGVGEAQHQHKAQLLQQHAMQGDASPLVPVTDPSASPVGSSSILPTGTMYGSFGRGGAGIQSQGNASVSSQQEWLFGGRGPSGGQDLLPQAPGEKLTSQQAPTQQPGVLSTPTGSTRLGSRRYPKHTTDNKKKNSRRVREITFERPSSRDGKVTEQPSAFVHMITVGFRNLRARVIHSLSSDEKENNRELDFDLRGPIEERIKKLERIGDECMDEMSRNELKELRRRMAALKRKDDKMGEWVVECVKSVDKKFLEISAPSFSSPASGGAGGDGSEGSPNTSFTYGAGGLGATRTTSTGEYDTVSGSDLMESSLAMSTSLSVLNNDSFFSESHRNDSMLYTPKTASYSVNANAGPDGSPSAFVQKVPDDQTGRVSPTRGTLLSSSLRRNNPERYGSISSAAGGGGHVAMVYTLTPNSLGLLQVDIAKHPDKYTPQAVAAQIVTYNARMATRSSGAAGGGGNGGGMSSNSSSFGAGDRRMQQYAANAKMRTSKAAEGGYFPGSPQHAPTGIAGSPRSPSLNFIHANNTNQNNTTVTMSTPPLQPNVPPGGMIVAGAPEPPGGQAPPSHSEEELIAHMILPGMVLPTAAQPAVPSPGNHSNSLNPPPDAQPPPPPLNDPDAPPMLTLVSNATNDLSLESATAAGQMFSETQCYPAAPVRQGDTTPSSSQRTGDGGSQTHPTPPANGLLGITIDPAQRQLESTSFDFSDDDDEQVNSGHLGAPPNAGGGSGRGSKPRGRRRRKLSRTLNYEEECSDNKSLLGAGEGANERTRSNISQLMIQEFC